MCQPCIESATALSDYELITHSLIMNLSQELTVFGRRQKLTFTMKLRPE